MKFFCFRSLLDLSLAQLSNIPLFYHHKSKKTNLYIQNSFQAKFDSSYPAVLTG